MSYMRIGYPLQWFKEGTTKSYVYSSYDGYVEDYDDRYEDDKSFCELIYSIVLNETDDEKYAEKILRTLAKKLGIDKDLRETEMSTDEFLGIVMGFPDPEDEVWNDEGC